ncbi:biotin/lipoyl-containing protein, partial [Streptomyces sp. NPDC049577]|uniref:biotin/lipoyl-containing protein n=1 Tax=Streptomyces sp. NPDC049577 TaxID=3155153 RepID=UPI00342A5B1B
MTASTQRFREFKMPDVGEGLTEAEILKWYVGVGDTVHDGQIVCEVETAKAAVEHELNSGNRCPGSPVETPASSGPWWTPRTAPTVPE